MSDFVPALVSLAVLAAAFFCAWSVDARRIRRLREGRRAAVTTLPNRIDGESLSAAEAEADEGFRRAQAGVPRMRIVSMTAEVGPHIATSSGEETREGSMS